jgi:hypothetical protein
MCQTYYSIWNELKLQLYYIQRTSLLQLAMYMMWTQFTIVLHLPSR